MANWKDYIWVMPIIGAIFTFISMAVPAITSAAILGDGSPAPFSVTMWMIGSLRFDFSGGGSVTGLVTLLQSATFGALPINLVPFIIGSSGVVVGAIIAVVSGVLGIRRDFRKSIALVGGILMFAFSLIFTIWLEAQFNLFSGKSVNVVLNGGGVLYYRFNVGIGIILPIIGGIICIASFFMDRIPSKERIVPQTPTQPKVTTQPPVTTQPQAKPTADEKFCPHCGSKVPGDYCPSCGKPFQPLIAQ